MKTSHELVLKSGVLPRLKLSEKPEGKGLKLFGPKTVVLLSDEIRKKIDQQDGKEKEYVRYVLEHEGQKMYYETKMRGQDGMPSYLVQELSQIPEGSEVILEMKRKGMKNYVSVRRLTNGVEAEIEDEEDVVDVL